MNTKKRVIAASAAATAGLFLAACDNTETEQAPAPAEMTTQTDDGAAGGTGGGAGTEGGTGTDG